MTISSTGTTRINLAKWHRDVHNLSPDLFQPKQIKRIRKQQQLLRTFVKAHRFGANQQAWRDAFPNARDDLQLTALFFNEYAIWAFTRLGLQPRAIYINIAIMRKDGDRQENNLDFIRKAIGGYTVEELMSVCNAFGSTHASLFAIVGGLKAGALPNRIMLSKDVEKILLPALNPGPRCLQMRAFLRLATSPEARGAGIDHW
jgi:hypothetical protein